MNLNRKKFEKIAAERRRIRDAVLRAIGPTTVYEAAKYYDVTRGTIGKILDDEIKGATSGRKPKGLSSSEVEQMMNEQMISRTPDEYAKIILHALSGI